MKKQTTVKDKPNEKDLKSLAYDTLVEIERLNASLREINKRLVEFKK